MLVNRPALLGQSGFRSHPPATRNDTFGVLAPPAQAGL